MLEFVAIEVFADDDAATFNPIVGFRNSYKFVEGESLKTEFPADAYYIMSPDFPKDIGCYDVLHVIGAELVVSSKVKSFFESENVLGLEFLAVDVFNHKKRKVSDDYFIVNTLNIIDCLDKDKTSYKWNALDSESMIDVKNMTIIESKVPEEVSLFRVKYVNNLLIFRRSLLDKMLEQGFHYFEPIELVDI